jgi:hypothetical protein
MLAIELSSSPPFNIILHIGHYQDLTGALLKHYPNITFLKGWQAGIINGQA